MPKTKDIEVIKLGTKRAGAEILKPGVYDLCRNNEHIGKSPPTRSTRSKSFPHGAID